MNKPYIYESSKNAEFASNEAIIVLPDIYCQTNYSKKTVDDFALNFKRPVFLLDYFSISTGEGNNFNEGDREKVHDLMTNFKGDEFVIFLKKVLTEIKETYPKIQEVAVIGFCFGGRLAYIAGGEKPVSKVVSFYGGGANTSNYVDGKSPIEYLISKKSGDIAVTSFFGINDPSIPEEDREKIKQAFTDTSIDFSFYEYDAGHAYFQEGRKNYNVVASKASWKILENIFNV